MNNIIVTAKAMFNDLEKAQSIGTIAKAMKKAVKVLGIKHDTEEMIAFLTEQQAKYQKPTKQATKEFQKFGLTVQRTRAFISVFGAYDEVEEVKNLYGKLLAKQK
ncbi:hypothetical protein [Moraxella sp. ZY210820]|uniref:hypothetical protein n=1 Tax=unclassified Moraxella TaxID=2685852 RepID=UPI002731789C|nr:hypothetical protein [Moraxella sp. ZY210820]WLF83773.1 hypothetical protein LU301_11090 [Moraxella sp. ZY210820]